MDKVYEQQSKRSKVDAGPSGEEKTNGGKSSRGSLAPVRSDRREMSCFLRRLTRRPGDRFAGGFALAGSVGVPSADGVPLLGLQQMS